MPKCYIIFITTSFSLLEAIKKFNKNMVKMFLNHGIDKENMFLIIFLIRDKLRCVQYALFWHVLNLPKIRYCI